MTGIVQRNGGEIMKMTVLGKKSPLKVRSVGLGCWGMVSCASALSAEAI